MAKAKRRASSAKKTAKNVAKKPARTTQRNTTGEVGAPQDQRLDVAAYARRITMDVPELLATSKKIASRVPPSSPVLRAHARAIADNHAVLAAAWKRVSRTDGDAVRPFDLAVDRAWSAVHGRLVGWDLIGDPAGVRAQRLMRILFPTGLSFTQLPWAAQWAEGEKRFARLAEEKLGPELRKLVGAEFVDALEARQREYGDALGMHAGHHPQGLETQALMPLLRATLQSIADYAVQIAAAHNAEPDAKKRATLRNAIAPIEAARRAAAAREGGDGEEPAALGVSMS